jgi:hypothetical protein
LFILLLAAWAWWALYLGLCLVSQLDGLAWRAAAMTNGGLSYSSSEPREAHPSMYSFPFEFLPVFLFQISRSGKYYELPHKKKNIVMRSTVLRT